MAKSGNSSPLLFNVIIIEDDPVMQRKIEIYVKKLGHHILAKFFEINEEQLYILAPLADVILLDINLPGKWNGLKLGEVYGQKYDTPIVYVTGSTDKGNFEAATKSNMYAYIQKPFTKAELEHALKLVGIHYSERKKLESVQHKLQDKEKSARLGEFAGSFIHDINNFTSIIAASFSKIRRNLKKIPPSDSLEKIDSAIELGIQSTKRISQLSHRYRKILFGDSSEVFMPINCHDFLEEMGSYFTERFSEGAINFKIDCLKEFTFISKEISLMQVLINLIGNSVVEIIEKEYVERWIKVEAYSRENKVIFKVVDSGKGVSKEVAAKVFNKGFSTRVDSLSAGAGVGLAFVKEKVETVLEGKIDLDEVAGNTTFVLSLPLRST